LGIVGFGLFLLVLSAKVTPYLYFARIPLLSLLLFAAVTPFLATYNLKSLLIGAYDLTGFSDEKSANRKDFTAGFALGLILVFCGMTIYTTATIALELGPVRAGIASKVAIPDWEKWVLAAIICIGVLLNALLVRTASTCGGASTAKVPIVGLVIGIVVAALLWLLVERFVQTLHGGLSQATSVYPWLIPVKVISDSLHNLPHHRFLKGYISSASDMEAPELKHLGALLSLLISLAVYIALRRSYLVPVIYLLLLLILSTWALSALTFLLDYFRLPIVVPLGLWFLFVARHPKTDHYYPIVQFPANAPPHNGSALRPAAVLKRALANKQPIALVASAGGGIQAIAWTAQVLTGLEKYTLGNPNGTPQKYRFSDAVTLLSGVSGGAVGNMFFASAYQNGSIPVNVLDRITKAALSSGLSQAAKGFAYSDLIRALFPFWVPHVYRDRGQALEKAWMVNAGCVSRRKDEDSTEALCNTLDKATLKDWQSDVVDGTRPALIFNATTVESGQRLAISTSPYKPVPPVDPTAPSSVIDFSLEYPNWDVLISTAARLSSTFTYVSPAARALPASELNDSAKPIVDLYTPLSASDPMRLHVVDGGYYENTGIGALVAWLNEALTELQGQALPKHILVITIGAFPNDANPKYAGRRGAIFQFEAPFLTLESLQGLEHPAGAWRELQLLMERLKASGSELIPVDFTFPLQGAPLSWHLRNCDKKKIEDGWDELKDKDKKLAEIDRFLNAYPN
jgi:hypothetical protein